MHLVYQSMAMVVSTSHSIKCAVNRSNDNHPHFLHQVKNRRSPRSLGVFCSPFHFNPDDFQSSFVPSGPAFLMNTYRTFRELQSNPHVCLEQLNLCHICELSMNRISTIFTRHLNMAATSLLTSSNRPDVTKYTATPAIGERSPIEQPEIESKTVH